MSQMNVYKIIVHEYLNFTLKLIRNSHNVIYYSTRFFRFHLLLTYLCFQLYRLPFLEFPMFSSSLNADSSVLIWKYKGDISCWWTFLSIIQKASLDEERLTHMSGCVSALIKEIPQILVALNGGVRIHLEHSYIQLYISHT